MLLGGPALDSRGSRHETRSAAAESEPERRGGECWSIGALEHWSIGVLEYWDSIAVRCGAVQCNATQPHELEGLRWAASCSYLPPYLPGDSGTVPMWEDRHHKATPSPPQGPLDVGATSWWLHTSIHRLISSSTAAWSDPGTAQHQRFFIRLQRKTGFASEIGADARISPCPDRFLVSLRRRGASWRGSQLGTLPGAINIMCAKPDSSTVRSYLQTQMWLRNRRIADVSGRR